MRRAVACDTASLPRFEGMSVPKAMRDRLVLVLVALLLPLGCEEEEEGEIGSPCESDEDCADDLICDEHDGEGTCQEEHEH